MQNFKGAIFDMDGTLLDSMPVWKRLTQRYLAQFNVHITDADYAVCEGFSQPQVAEYFLKRYPNLPLTQQQMLDGMDEMITSRYETIAKPKDGVIDFLEGLRARGVKMAIATLTARRHAEKALIDRDMMKYFEFMPLSGGERQRIGLARAFLHNAPFMLLDEPTSNLDSLNEAVILKALNDGREDKTIVLVSHRESTMKIADKVYSVENGRMS